MLRKHTVRPSLVDKRTMRKQTEEHRYKLKRATHAIDCVSPPTYSHLTLKLKKLQIEHERIWRIENENRRLLSRLAEIMNRSRADCKARFSAYNTKLRKGARIRPISQHTVLYKNSNADKKNLETKESEWPSNREVVRPHTVAVMARKCSLSFNKCSTEIMKDLANKPRKGHSLILCGCSSRQPVPTSLMESLSDVEKKPKLTSTSPLNDVTDLLCGIQSVEITVKQQPSTE